jgi:NADPH:quinone reductase-like Zn-dependent oxidoreductase
VIATARRESHDFLRELGAFALVDREAVPVGQAGQDVDVVVDLVGGRETSAALRALRSGGVLLAIADGADDETRADAEYLGVRVLEPLVEPDGRGLDSVAGLVAEGAVKVVVDSVFALEDAGDAHRRLEAGGVRGKVVLAVR